MKNKQRAFDEQARKALEGIQPIYRPEQWNAFEEKLDAAEAEEAAELARFDQTFREKTSDLNPALKKAHWERMSRELDEAFSWKAKIVRYKVVETLLMLAVLWTVYNFYSAAATPIAATTPPQIVQSKDQISGPPSSSAAEKKKKTLSESPAAKEDTATVKKKITPSRRDRLQPVPTRATYGFRKTDRVPAVGGWRQRAGTPAVQGVKARPVLSGKPVAAQFSDPYNLNQQNALSPVFKIAEASKNSAPAVSENVGQTASPVNPRAPAADGRERAAIALDKTGAPLDRLSLNQPGLERQNRPLETDLILPGMENLNENKAASSKSLGHIALLTPLDPQANESVESETRPLDQIVIPAPQIKRSRSFHIGMFSAVNFDFANTFFGPIYNRKEIKPGYGAGLSAGWRIGRWELETGLGYSNKAYNPVNLTILSGSFNAGYTNEKQGQIELDMIHVPVRINYHFPLSGKWDMYASAGASFNVSARTVDNKQFTDASSIDFTKPFAPVSQYSDPVPQALVYTPGVFENNGSLQNNYYYTVSGGFGVEYRQNRRFSVFLQPDYSLHVGQRGIGVGADQINTFSFLFGTKVRL